MGMTIRVKVRLFAVQRELAGTREVGLDLADDADVEAAWSALVVAHPILAPGRASLRFARNGDYADPTTRLTDGEGTCKISLRFKVVDTHVVTDFLKGSCD